ncbi:unnamed protein product [Allacma fusca]|uniref:Uncharacterized protein n=1 Tax=Allacma fusca TaxID=39272 RepID=A0A8J2PK04_9HEXA|nr:unnamed protein product [Allacma fusca]
MWTSSEMDIAKLTNSKGFKGIQSKFTGKPRKLNEFSKQEVFNIVIPITTIQAGFVLLLNEFQIDVIAVGQKNTARYASSHNGRGAIQQMQFRFSVLLQSILYDLLHERELLSRQITAIRVTPVKTGSFGVIELLSAIAFIDFISQNVAGLLISF